MALIKSVDDLRSYVSINVSSSFKTYEPFVEDAQDKFIAPYFGDKLLTTIEDNTDDALYKKICRALAPFALALATDEMSINFGESGHTVVRSESVAPASDAKIAKAEGSLFSRAWQNLDKAIDYVIKHKADYSDWEEAEFSRHMKTALFSNARDFQEKGLVDIEYSPLTFHHLRMLILRIEISETMKLLPAAFRAEHSADPSAMPASILSALQGYTGSRVASLHTSQITRTQRSPERERTEFSPLIRPLYDDAADTGNYFARQADFWREAVLAALSDAEVIAPDDRTVKWNSGDKRIFVANATRSE